MIKKDKSQSAIKYATLLLGGILIVSVVLIQFNSSDSSDIVETTYNSAPSEPEFDAVETEYNSNYSEEETANVAVNTEPTTTVELLEDEVSDENVTIESVDITSVSFPDAFKQARALLGPGNTFEWNGMVYSTNLSDEVVIPLEHNDTVHAGITIASELSTNEPVISKEIVTTQ